MRKITKEIVRAFYSGEKLRISNTETDGESIYLHSHEIVRTVDGHIEITLAGWNTNTTRERLNGLHNVSVSTKLGQPYLNGKPWDGQWARITDK